MIDAYINGIAPSFSIDLDLNSATELGSINKR